MADPPSTPCRWGAMSILMRLKTKIREKLWVSQIFNDPDLHMETEASTPNHPQPYYDAPQAFPPPTPQSSQSGDLFSQMQHLEETTTVRHEQEAFITLEDLGIQNQQQWMDHRSSLQPIYGMAEEYLVDDDDQSSLGNQQHRSSSQPIYGMEEDYYLDADDQSSLQNGWSAPSQLGHHVEQAEVMDTGDSCDEFGPVVRQSSAVEWQRILFLQRFLGVDGAVRAGPGWKVVLGIVSAFKRISGLIRRRRERTVENQSPLPTPRRIKSGDQPTKYKGIRPRNGKWVSEIRIGGTQEKVWLGSYNTDKEAALAYDAGKHHCSLKRSRGFNFSDSPRLLGAPQNFAHLSSVERRTKIQRLAEDHAIAYASADIR